MAKAKAKTENTATETASAFCDGAGTHGCSAQKTGDRQQSDPDLAIKRGSGKGANANYLVVPQRGG